jgi:[acyl-carrier-protein] S-malonyltransferase
VRATFDEAGQGCGLDLWSISQIGSEAELNRTEVTQPALLAAGVAVWRVWNERGGAQPAAFAGHSLGEYSALVAAGALSLSDGAALVRERGRLMQDAVPAGVGAMAAILMADDVVIAQACTDAAQGQIVAPANFNSPGQTVIAGHAEAVDRAIALLAERGVKKAVKLAVSVPSHSALMQPAADALRTKMQTLSWSLPDRPVVRTPMRRAHDRSLRCRTRWCASCICRCAGPSVQALPRAASASACGRARCLQACQAHRQGHRWSCARDLDAATNGLD